MVDRLITLFESSDRDFSTNGIGPLPDAISCEVSEERNGPYELEMEYPITGRYYDEIQFRRILYTKPNAYSNRQPFRIYAISKPINGIVTVNAQHISYDLADYSVSPFHATTVGDAFTLLKYSMDDSANCPFTFYTDKTTEANMGFNIPMNARTILGGIEGSILDKYRGEYEWDGYLVKFLENRGENRGVTIRYGKNMTDIRQEENMMFRQNMTLKREKRVNQSILKTITAVLYSLLVLFLAISYLVLSSMVMITHILSSTVTEQLLKQPTKQK